MIPDVANPFFSQIARGAEDLAYISGYNVFLVNTDEDIEREKAALNSLLEKQVDGAILCSSRLPDDSLRDYIKRFPSTLLINRELDVLGDNYATINVDDVSGAQQAISHLIDRGHTTIGLIAGPMESTSSQRRQNGFLKGLDLNGLDSNPELVIGCEPNIEGGFRAASHLLSTQEDVTAIVSFNDLVAFGVFQACEEMQLSIPQDVSVVGFDDIPLATLVKPNLTTL